MRSWCAASLNGSACTSRSAAAVAAAQVTGCGVRPGPRARAPARGSSPARAGCRRPTRPRGSAGTEGAPGSMPERRSAAAAAAVPSARPVRAAASAARAIVEIDGTHRWGAAAGSRDGQSCPGPRRVESGLGQEPADLGEHAAQGGLPRVGQPVRPQCVGELVVGHQPLVLGRKVGEHQLGPPTSPDARVRRRRRSDRSQPGREA